MKQFITAVAIMAVALIAAPGWCAVQVLADFESGVPTNIVYGLPGETALTVTATASTDTPSSGSDNSLQIVVPETGGWYQWEYPEKSDGEFYCTLTFSTPVNMSAGFLNFYLKGTTTAQPTGFWVSAFAGSGQMGYAQFASSNLPAAWTKFSVPLDTGDWEAWDEGGLGHNMTAVTAMHFGWSAAAPVPMTVLIDHVTVSTTAAEGDIPAGPPPADCEDPFIAGSSPVAIAGEEFSLNVSGIEADCAESVTWAKDGENVSKGTCATITPAGATGGQQVTVQLFDNFGNPVNMATDVDHAEIGFYKPAPTGEPITIRIDHVTLTDSPAAGMLGASSGTIYVLSECEEGEGNAMLGWSGDAVKTFSTDAAGAGSTGSVQLEYPGNAEIWSEHYGNHVVATGATHFNFYVKVVSGTLPPWTKVEIGTTTEAWYEDGGRADYDNAFTFPAVGGDWAYVSIPLSSMTLSETFTVDYVVAAGLKFGVQGEEAWDVMPATYDEAGIATITLPADLSPYTYGWVWAPEYVKGGDLYTEWNPLADALAAGGSCAAEKAMGSIGDDGLSLVFNPLEESDAGEYCATVTIDSVPTEVCFTLDNIYPEGTTLPVAGIVGLGALAVGVAGAFVGLRRKK